MKNVGSTDKIIRIAIGVLAAIAAFVIGIASVPGIILLIVAAIAIVTAFTGFCPLYRVIGVNTSGRAK